MARPPSRLPLILFGLLTVMTLGGPFALWAVMSGGARSSWPPDRPVEWWMLLGTLALFAALMIACIGTATATLRASKDRPLSNQDLDLDLGVPDPTEPSSDLDLHLDRPAASRDENDLRL